MHQINITFIMGTFFLTTVAIASSFPNHSPDNKYHMRNMQCDATQTSHLDLLCHDSFSKYHFVFATHNQRDWPNHSDTYTLTCKSTYQSHIEYSSEVDPSIIRSMDQLMQQHAFELFLQQGNLSIGAKDDNTTHFCTFHHDQHSVALPPHSSVINFQHALVQQTLTDLPIVSSAFTNHTLTWSPAHPDQSIAELSSFLSTHTITSEDEIYSILQSPVYKPHLRTIIDRLWEQFQTAQITNTSTHLIFIHAVALHNAWNDVLRTFDLATDSQDTALRTNTRHILAHIHLDFKKSANHWWSLQIQRNINIVGIHSIEDPEKLEIFEEHELTVYIRRNQTFIQSLHIAHLEYSYDAQDQFLVLHEQHTAEGLFEMGIQRRLFDYLFAALKTHNLPVAKALGKGISGVNRRMLEKNFMELLHCDPTVDLAFARCYDESFEHLSIPQQLEIELKAATAMPISKILHRYGLKVSSCDIGLDDYEADVPEVRYIKMR